MADPIMESLKLKKLLFNFEIFSTKKLSVVFKIAIGFCSIPHSLWSKKGTPAGHVSRNKHLT
jgi:hypothetical protein